ncbi:MAG: N-acetylmuramoyl-L-alanine amidase [Chitinispirillales bacterium]|jgi:N-acetylmuramoyl-L-alanine amidase|nr:N-acetylmuramoyl-L-alanine amidase [Chitinispirillales bacterium]
MNHESRINNRITNFCILHSALLFIIILTASVSADIIIRKIPEGKSVSVRSFEREGTVYVSLTDFAAQTGFGWKWERLPKRLTFWNDSGKIAFVQDNSFYTVDTSVQSLQSPPIRKGGTLYLPAPFLVSAFGSKYSGSLSWDSRASSIVINTLIHSILSVRSEVKQNGTVVSIALADSLPYECTYVHPNLVLNFAGGTLDPSNVRRRAQRVGVVDSVFTLQYEKSAQVSLMLNRTVEKPHIDYNRSTRTLMISLRPQIEQRKTAPLPVKVDVPIIRTVVIDPGHGGRDPGAIGPGGVMEKDIVLGIGLELKKSLEKAGIKVFMTRDKDVFVPLRNRTNFANEKKADIFVSIHTNAVAGSKTRLAATKGYKIYFLSQAKNEDDKLAAMRENAVIELEEKTHNYDALQNVLINIAGNEYLKQSQELCIIMEQILEASQKRIPKLHLGVGQANFWVLNGAYMPSVLVECGFISNPEEEKLLTDKRVQAQLAASLSDAIIKFKKQFETGL